jgi:hypothetical protein
LNLGSKKNKYITIIPTFIQDRTINLLLLIKVYLLNNKMFDRLQIHIRIMLDLLNLQLKLQIFEIDIIITELLMLSGF